MRLQYICSMKGSTLKQLREAKGLTQAELAAKAGIGTAKSGRVMVARYETDDSRNIPSWRVDALKKALK